MPEPFSSRPIHRSVCLIGAVLTGVARPSRPWERPEQTFQSPQNRQSGWTVDLEGDQLGELGRDVCHRLFCSAQAASRGEQGADFAESFIRRVVHDGNELVTR